MPELDVHLPRGYGASARFAGAAGVGPRLRLYGSVT
jgi:hypothetical protein